MTSNSQMTPMELESNSRPTDGFQVYPNLLKNNIITIFMLKKFGLFDAKFKVIMTVTHL